MKERILTISEQRLVLETKISERALIVYVLESSLLDEGEGDTGWSEDYKGALQDEIINHNLIIKEYKEELKKAATMIKYSSKDFHKDGTL